MITEKGSEIASAVLFSPLASVTETMGQQLRGVVRARDAAEAAAHKWRCWCFYSWGAIAMGVAVWIYRSF